jgi:hypothetical protein
MSRSAVRFGPATISDVRWLAARLRKADREELEAAHGAGANLYLVLLQAVAVSERPLVAIASEPIALLGVAPLKPGVAAPWLVGSDLIAKHARVLLLAGRAYVDEWSARFPVLTNHVDARNDASIRWLRRLGFTIHPPAPFGPLGLPFHLFDRVP